jgi:hypothetical protein
LQLGESGQEIHGILQFGAEFGPRFHVPYPFRDLLQSFLVQEVFDRFEKIPEPGQGSRIAGEESDIVGMPHDFVEFPRGNFCVQALVDSLGETVGIVQVRAEP